MWRTQRFRLPVALFLFVVATTLTCTLCVGEAVAQSSLERYDRAMCKPYGGLTGIVRDFSYVPWFLGPVVEDGSTYLAENCKQYCPQCIRYCYIYTIACGTTGTRFTRYSQVRPFVLAYADNPTYTSESEEQAELAQIQAALASSNFWRPLSPYPQLLILAFLVLLSWISRRGRDKNEEYWGWNGPLNVYFGLSLLTFNTSSDSNKIVQTADQYLFFHSWIFVIALLLFFITNAVPFAKGWNYLFVKHPAADIVNSAVSDGTPIEGPALAKSLRLDPRALLAWRPHWYWKQEAQKARRLQEKLDQDAELARAAIARERARAELRDEKRLTAEEKRERVWRGRTLS
jgi:hypothetical protein